MSVICITIFILGLPYFCHSDWNGVTREAKWNGGICERIKDISEIIFQK